MLQNLNMLMNRRSALKQLAIAAGGMALLPSCNFGPERVAVALDNLQIDLDHQDLLARVVETIIPSGEIPGAETLDLYRFVLVMVDDCLPQEEQQAFVSGLYQLRPFIKEKLRKSFSKEQAANEAILQELIALEAQPEPNGPGLKEIQTFLKIAKQYSMQGFLVSEYVLTEQFPYQLVPGEYQACVSTDGLTVM